MDEPEVLAVEVVDDPDNPIFRYEHTDFEVWYIS
jgi:hypothetical protein